jgi:hypothetical protein
LLAEEKKGSALAPQPFFSCKAGTLLLEEVASPLKVWNYRLPRRGELPKAIKKKKLP